MKWSLLFLGGRLNRALATTASRAQPKQFGILVGMWIALTSKGVFVEEDSGPAEVSHVKLPRDVIMLKEFH